MHIFAYRYGNAAGPLGFPRSDKQAQALAGILKALPKHNAFAYRKLADEKAATEIGPGERGVKPQQAVPNLSQCYHQSMNIALEFCRSLGAVPLDDWTVYRLTSADLARLAQKPDR
jgi:hypothetical protein